MGVVFTNNAETTLAAAITSTSATSISVTSSSTFPAIQAGEHFYATLDDGTNNEIVKVTGVSGTTWTVVRASDSTTARTFANGITVQLRATAALLTDIQENIAAKSANQTVYNATAASNATAYDVGVNPGVEANAMVFLDGVMQHHDTFSFSGSTLTFDAAPTNGTKIEVIVDNLINLQSSNLTTDTFTATSGQTAFTLSDAPAAENNLIVFIDGVFQDQGTYSISNHTLTLATGAVQGRTVTVYIINPVNIGTPSDGTVTSSKLSGNITMPGTLTVGSHDVAFDSPTFVVDNANSRVGLGTATPSVPVDIVGEVKISSHLNMPDNAIAKFGTGSDLQIYHSGTNSHIADTGEGNLYLDATNLIVRNGTGTETYMTAANNGGVVLYHDNTSRFSTTSSGIDVTGTATMDGLTVDGTGSFTQSSNAATALTTFTNSNAGASARASISFASDTGSSVVGTVSSGWTVDALNANETFMYGSHGVSLFAPASQNVRILAGGSERLRVDSSGRFIVGNTSAFDSSSFCVDQSGLGQFRRDGTPLIIRRDGSEGDLISFEDDGSTVGSIGTRAGDLTIGTGNCGLIFNDGTEIIIPANITTNAVADAAVDLGYSAGRFKDLYLSGNAYVDTNATFGGYVRTKQYLQVYEGNSQAGFIGKEKNIVGSGSSLDMVIFAESIADGGDLHFMTGGSSTKRMSIDSSGNVGIGTSNPLQKLVVSDGGGYGFEFAPNNSSVNQILSYDRSGGAYRDFKISANEIRLGYGQAAANEAMRIASNGRVSIGTTSTNAGLTVANGDIRATGAAVANDANSFSMSQESSGGTLCARGPGGSTRGIIQLSVNEDDGGNGIIGLKIDSNGDLLAPNLYGSAASQNDVRYNPISGLIFYNTSSRRYKENIQDIPDGILTKINQARPVTFDEIGTDVQSFGLIAEELDELIPELVTRKEVDGAIVPDGITYSMLSVYLLKAIQEQQTQIETLKAEIQELKDNG